MTTNGNRLRVEPLGVYSLYESAPSKALNRPLMKVPGAGLAGEIALATSRLFSTLASPLIRVDLGGLSSVRTRAADCAALLFAAREALNNDLNGFFTPLPHSRFDLRTMANSRIDGTIPHCSIVRPYLPLIPATTFTE